MSGQEGEDSGPEDARACGQKILPSRLCCVSTLRKGGCDERAALSDHGSTLTARRTTAARQGYGSWRYRKGQPSVSPVSRSCSLESGHRCALAGSTRLLGELEQSAGRFRRWAASGVLQRLFETLCGDPDLEYVLIDSTTVPVHQKAAGAKGALGASAWAACAGFAVDILTGTVAHCLMLIGKISIARWRRGLHGW